MTILKGDRNESSRALRAAKDDKGRFVPLACPDINCGGRLRYEGEGTWRCDGLVDPNDENRPLEACSFVHFQGEQYSGDRHT